MVVYLNSKYSAWISLKDKVNLTDKDGNSLVGKPVNLMGLRFDNPNGSKAYIQVFDAKASDVTLGTTKPIDSFEIAATGFLRIFVESKEALTFEKGLSFAATTTSSGSTLVTTELEGRFFYKD